MSYKISLSDRFEKEIKKLLKKFPSLKSEYSALIISLKQDPFQGTPIGKDCYKIRIGIASKGKGKSGGARVITYVYVAGNTIFLLSIYDKSERPDITDTDLLSMLKSFQ